MIILDEQLQNPDIGAAIERWYPGAVGYILRLRPNSLVKDDNIATLLHSAQRPVFVTINVSDFWRRIQAHSSYCIVAIDISQEGSYEVPDILRQILNRPEFKTRSLRMGKVIRVRKGSISYYEHDGQIQLLK